MIETNDYCVCYSLRTLHTVCNEGLLKGSLMVITSSTLSMTTFLSIQECSVRTGKSGSTIRRFIKSIVNNPQHADRGLIDPSPADIAKVKGTDVPFAWRVSEVLLLRAFPKAGEALGEGFKPKEIQEEGITDGLFTLLKGELQYKERHLQETAEQLKVKDQQILKQSEIIQSLNDRLREGNLLMGSLQQHLSLSGAKKESPQETVVDAGRGATLSRPAQKTKSRLFARMFGF